VKPELKSAKKVIDRLTNDEDVRQELWLHYVSKNSTNSLAKKLTDIHKESTLHEKLQQAIIHVHSNPLTDSTIVFLSNFSDFEQSIMFLLLMGFSIEEVSEYKGISSVRINQCISIIRSNSAWEQYGFKEKL
jgi:hypothetical protein